MNLAEIKSRINPAYQDVIGTESHERKWLCDRIDELERQLAERDAEFIKTHNWLCDRNEQVALLREALERCAMFKLQPDTIQQITNRVLAATEEKK